ncbi:MAG: MFS transporter [Deltaproteobacteria bacterium]|nr:MFS transporter [Deltaproteobacteria bacterium]
MPTLADRRGLRLFVLCALYFAQGVPWGFVAITLVAWLGERGMSTEEIGGLMALATLPWSFKWAFGPLIDAVPLPGGRRRPWILLAQAAMALTIGAMAAFGDLAAAPSALAMVIFLHNCFNAMQDVAVDALAVDLLDEDERGRANGMMYGSKYLGGAVGGAGLAQLIAGAGMRTALFAQTALLCAIFLLPLLFREGATRNASPAGGGVARARALLGDLLRAFSLRSTVVGAGLALGVQLAAGVLSTVAAVFYTQHLGWTMEDYASVTGGWAIGFGLLGSVGGGWIADRIGHRRMIAIASVLLGTLWIGFGSAESLWSNRSVVVGVLLAESMLQALVSVGLFALFMDIAWPRVAATQFTAYMAMLNLSTTIGHRLAGPLDAWLDFGGLYVVAGAVQVAVIVLLWPIDPHQTRAVLGDGD